MSTLIRRCWTTPDGQGRTRQSAVHYFPPTGLKPWWNGSVALCGVPVPIAVRASSMEPLGTLINDPGPEVSARPCRRCEKIAKRWEEDQ